MPAVSAATQVEKTADPMASAAGGLPAPDGLPPAGELPAADELADRPLAARFGSLNTDSLPRQVARALVGSILVGHFRPGEPLPASGDLAREFGVSRPVVREALKIVSTLGMVESRQGRFSRVSERGSWNDLSAELLSARLETGAIGDVIADVLELRRLIETEAASLAAQRATAADLAAMRAHLDALAASVGDPQAYTVHDVAFHDAILRATHNRLLLQLIDRMREVLVFARTISMTAQPNLLPDSQEGHLVLFEAIASHDPDAARRAMAEHLAWAEQVNVAEYRRTGATQSASA
ncbi:MAG: FadR/GntR family transcriptional regulator [Candidatus Limnocylindrales bacterium]